MMGAKTAETTQQEKKKDARCQSCPVPGPDGIGLLVFHFLPAFRRSESLFDWIGWWNMITWGSSQTPGRGVRAVKPP